MPLPPFWTDAHSAEVERLRRMALLYEGKHEVVLHSEDGGWSLPIYVTINLLGDRLTKTLTTLVWRDFPNVTATNSDQQDNLTAILTGTRFFKAAKDAQDVISYGGYASLKLYRSARTGAYRLRRWGKNPGEFAWWEREGDDAYAVTFYRDEVLSEYGNRRNVTVTIGERFELDGDRVFVSNRAYLSTSGRVDLKSPVPLSSLPGNPIEEEAILRMYELPGVLIEGPGIGSTDYSLSLISLQKSTARTITQRDIAIAVNEMPVVNYPVSMLTPDGRVDLGKLWVSFREEGQNPQDCVPINFNSWNGNLNESAKQMEILEEEFYTITGMSPAVDGKVSGGSESGYARRLGMIKTEALVNDRRQDWNDPLRWAGRAIPAFAASQDEGTVFGDPVTDLSTHWPPAIPVDPTAVSQDTERAMRGGWMSRYEAVRREHPEWTDAQITAELERIDADAEAQRIAAVPTFFTPTQPA